MGSSRFIYTCQIEGQLLKCWQVSTRLMHLCNADDDFCGCPHEGTSRALEFIDTMQMGKSFFQKSSVLEKRLVQ